MPSALTGNTSGLASATSPGLVGTGTQTFAGKKTLDGGALIKGDTSGVAIAASYVGEQTGTLRSGTGGFTYSTRTTNTLTTSTSTAISVTLNKGFYLISGSVKCFLSTGISGIISSRLRIGGTSVSDDIAAYVSSTTAGSAVLSCPVIISADSTIVSFAAEINTGTSGGNSHEMFVTRIF